MSKIITVVIGSLVSALLILLGLNFGNTIFHWWPIYADTMIASDKFEVYRDLLIIVLTTLGIVGYFAYKEIRRKLEEDLGRSLAAHFNLILARLYGNLSYAHWREYENMDPGERRYEELSDLTIEEAQKAVSYYEILDNIKYEGETAAQIMNLAYHLAVRKRPEDKDEALRLVNKNWMKAAKFMPGNEHNIRETRVYVILKFSDKAEEREEAKKELEDLMKWTRAEKTWKDKNIRKYSREFGISLNYQC